MRSRLARLIGCTAVAILVAVTAACTGDSEPPVPSASATQPRPFTIMTTDALRTADPAAVADTGSTMLTGNVFQTLMTVDPTVGELKPDAARDCGYFESRTVFTCTLRPDVKFSNGQMVTSADVKFSIQRATRLDVTGSSASSLASLRRIETPDDVTIRFILSRYDTQFGWALATPASSIVSAEVYNSDRVQENDEPILGSGPFKVTAVTEDTIELARNPDFRGYAAGRIDRIVIRTMPDSASIEEAMAEREVDVVWRGLGSAAVERLQTQIDASAESRSKSGYSQLVLPGARVQQLFWNPESKLRAKEELRAAITAALQEDRTLDSVVPPEVPGHRTSFEIGGKADIEISWNNRIQLTLAYDSTAPNSLDLATKIRTRLEDTGGMSVLLRADDPDADLSLVDRKARTPTGLDWLQPVIDDPLDDRELVKTITEADTKARYAGPDTPELNAALATLQSAAAESQTVLPISQTNENVFVGPETTVDQNSFGPGWQLGLWGMSTDR